MYFFFMNFHLKRSDLLYISIVYTVRAKQSFLRNDGTFSLQARDTIH